MQEMGKYLNKNKKHFASFLTVTIFVFTFFVLAFLNNVPVAQAAAYACVSASTTGANWNVASTWTACNSTYPGANYPTDTYTVSIRSGDSVTVNANINRIESLSFTGSGAGFIPQQQIKLTNFIAKHK